MRAVIYKMCEDGLYQSYKLGLAAGYCCMMQTQPVDCYFVVFLSRCYYYTLPSASHIIKHFDGGTCECVGSGISNG